MKPPVRVLIVDDSASMRALLNRILAADPEIEVVGMAPEPHTAREMIKALNPDVLTLDVEMPGMDGLSFLEKIMRLRPMPVVMCSTLTASGAEASIEALRTGAFDCIGKPVGDPLALSHDAERLRHTVKAAGRSGLRPQAATPVPVQSAGAGQRDVLIAIGSSTGGVEALFSLFGAFPADCPPVLVVQHMPPVFTASFAARLDRACRPRVVEAVGGMQIERGCIYIAPGGEHHMEVQGGLGGRIKLRPGNLESGHRPSVDMLFRSVARTVGKSAIGVILTGMGSDGAAGLKAMRDAGAHTFGQNEASCVVYGMPRAAAEAGAVERELSLTALPEAVLSTCRT